MFDWFRDGVNPRGAEYGATARAARAAQRQADAAEDMLELEMADSSVAHEAIVRRIVTRREREQGWRTFWRGVDLVFSLAFVAAILWILLAPASEAPQSAVTHDAPASASMIDHATPALVRQAQAPALDDCTTPECLDIRAHAKEAVQNCRDAGLEDDCDGL